MSLTSYRTAPPRVTALIAAGPEPEAILETTSRPSAQPADLAILTVSPTSRASRLERGAKFEKEAPSRLRGKACCCVRLCRPGSDLLSRTLRHSTIGAGGLNDRVRNGIGWGTPARTTRSAKPSAQQLIVYNLDD
jgi:hypothetical protein